MHRGPACKLLGIMRALLSVLLLFSATLLCSAQSSSPLEQYAGQYVMRLGERNLIVVSLTMEHGSLAGTLKRPRAFGGGTYIRVTNPTTGVYAVQSATIVGDHLKLVVRNTQKVSDTDTWNLTLTGPGSATLGPDEDEVAVDPFPLVRVPAQPEQAIATDWVPNRSYGADDGAPSSAVMARIFDEDQKPRQSVKTFNASLGDVGEADAARRQQVKDLLAKGELHSGEDFEKAAFIFQHGGTPDDYLMAHTLAMIAVARGDAKALWIATATLDRYLQSIGKSQIYGTQYRRDAKVGWTQDPYDRKLIPDALRRALDVKSQPMQAEQLDIFKRQDK